MKTPPAKLPRVAGLMALWAFCLAPLVAFGQEPEHPLKPADRSSPRTALKTFLDAGDVLETFLKQDYMPAPSRAKFHHLMRLHESLLQGLDLSQLPPALRGKKSRDAARDLYEVLSRIQLPPLDEIPEPNQLELLGDTQSASWVIPNTEIVLVRSQSGAQSGQFLFSPETVLKADDFYERVRGLPYTRPVPLENIQEIIGKHGGWMIPYRWIQAMPSWLRVPLAGQPRWKWIALVLILSVFLLLMRLVYRLSRWSNSRHPFLQSLAKVTLPTFFLAATPTVAYLALVQVNFIDTFGSEIEAVSTVVMFLSGAWLFWRMSPVVAEAIIASPKIPPESINAHLIRIFARLLGIVAVAMALAGGANRMGIPVYGIVAGLGVGGLAIALAAQPTVENLIGGLSLFADKPIRIGDLCQYGTEIGIVEAIGIRSTRIRGFDRKLTTIPNGMLSKMSIINYDQRDRILIQSVISVRYETTPEQLRYLLVKIREMLLGHPRIHHDPARARFFGFGDSSLDIEVFAYVKTRDRQEFFGIREDIFLRIMDIVQESGTGFAFPSQTLYVGRDNGLDAGRTEAAEAQVRQWRDEDSLAFPNFSPDQMRKIRGSVVYPAPGTTEAEAEKTDEKNQKEK